MPERAELKITTITITSTVHSPVLVLNTEEIIEAELHTYSEDPGIPAKTSDKKSWNNPLHWWRDNETKQQLFCMCPHHLLRGNALSLLLVSHWEVTVFFAYYLIMQMH
jgi:hypothetical protein